VILGKWSENWSCYWRRNLELELDFWISESQIGGRAMCIGGLWEQGTRTPFRDYVGGHKNCTPRRSKMSTINVTTETFFEGLYLVRGLRQFMPFFTMPSAPTPPPLSLRPFLDFCTIFLAFQFFCHESVPGLPVRDCVTNKTNKQTNKQSSSNLALRWPNLSTIDAIVQTIFERLYLISGLAPISGPESTVHMHPHPHRSLTG